MKLIFTTLLIFVCHLIIGQNFITISGKVIDAESNLPLPYANIGIKGQSIGTVSNSNGEFDFYVSREFLMDTMEISYVGYNVYHRAISPNVGKQNLTIYLTKRPIVLDEIVLNEKKISAKEIVQSAFEKIEENFNSDPFILEGFFRDWSLAEFTDNNKDNEGTLLEAAITIYDKGYAPNVTKKSQEEVYIKEIRRGQVGEQWGHYWNTLDQLLKQNFVKYPRSKGNIDLLKGPLDFPNDLHYSIDSIIGDTNNGTFIIKAVSFYEQDFPAVYRIFVSDKSLSILRIDFKGSIPENNHQDYIHQHGYQLTDVHITMRFKQFGRYFYPNYLHRKWKVRQFDRESGEIVKNEEYSRELLVNNIITKVQAKKDRSLGVLVTPKKSLENQMLEYRPQFWENYNIIKENPAEDKIANVVEKEESFGASAPKATAFVGSSVQDQSYIKVSAKVLDYENEEPLVLAHINVKGTALGTVSNELGEFEFNIPSKYSEDTLIVSFLGFKNYKSTVIDAKRSMQKAILLKQDLIKLKEVVVLDNLLEPKEIVQKAIDNISKVYPNDEFVLEGFYRDWFVMDMKDGTQKASLAEAAITVHDKGYRSRGSKVVTEKVYINEVREIEYPEHLSNNFEFFLKQNPIRYQKVKANMAIPGVLDFPNDLEYELESVISNVEDDGLYVVSVAIKDKYAKYTLYISTEDYTILRIDLNAQAPKNSLIYLHPDDPSQEMETIDNTIRFRRFQGKAYLSYMRQHWTWEITDSLNAIDKGELFTELLVNNIFTSKEEVAKKKSQLKKLTNKKKETLFDQNTEYNAKFWENYNVIKSNPLNNRLQEALNGSNTPIEDQFQNPVVVTALIPQRQDLITISGKVIDINTEEPIPFAHIFIKNKALGTISNKEGDFDFKVVEEYFNDTLVISYLGYDSFEESVGSLSSENHLKVSLTQNAVLLDEVVVTGLTPDQIVREAIDNIPLNYPDSPIIQEGFYRDWKIVDSVGAKPYTSLIEAAISIYDKGYYKRGSGKKLQEQVYLSEIRKNLAPGTVYNYFDFLLKHNFLKYRQWKVAGEIESVLDFPNTLTYEFMDQIENDGESIYIIKAILQNQLGFYKLYISTVDYAILRIDLTGAASKVDVLAKNVHLGEGITSKLIYLDNTLRFRRVNNKVLLSYIKSHWKVTAEVDETKERIVDREFYQEILINNTINLRSGEKPNISGTLMNEKKSLEMQAKEYNASFWDSYNIVKENPLDLKILELLEDKEALGNQFQKAGSNSTEQKSVSKWHFTRADSLKGTLTPLRTSYDVGYYHLDIEVDPVQELIRGVSTIKFRVLDDVEMIQIDLYEKLKIEKIQWGDSLLNFNREYSAVYIDFPRKLIPNSIEEIKIHYSGRPVDPDWDIPYYAAFIWTKDIDGTPWIQAICQGNGAHGWWPNKDHLSDEPDSAAISITVPSEFQAIANGKLQSKTAIGDTKAKYDWKVSYPINNYNLTLNVGNYHHIKDQYVSTDTLIIDYYVLPADSTKANKALEVVKPMLKIFEEYFGSYPFPKDGFTLIQTPHPMEHQSCVAIGNYFEEDLILHESAHEWWGNSVSCTDMAELWIHEAFATYAVALFKEKYYGIEYSNEYFNDLSNQVIGEDPLIGVHGVNHIHYNIDDMYSKGALMLHTLRNVINDDDLWFGILGGIQKEFRHKSVATEDIVDYVNYTTGTDYTYFFNEYLKYTELPELHILIENRDNGFILKYRWSANEADFRMPLQVDLGGNDRGIIFPTTEWQTSELHLENPEDFYIDDTRYYVNVIWD